MTQMLSKTLGQVIKKERENRGITQQELSERARISRNYISDIECGRYIPSTETLVVIATILEIDLNILKNDGNTI